MPSGIYIRTEKIRKILSDSHIGLPSPMLGKHHSEKTKIILSEKRKKQEPTFLGKHHSFESKQKISDKLKGNSNCKGFHRSEENKKKISKTLTGRKLSAEHVRNALRRRSMSSLEIKMNNIIQQNDLPYKFVGNGEFLIENKCPDFINTNGEKIAIEVYCRKHKDAFKNGGHSQWIRERTELFSQYGWIIKFFDAVDLNDENKTIRELR